MKNFLLILLFIIVIPYASAQNIESIDSLSKSMNFTFKMPNGYSEVPLKKQPDVLVTIAFKKYDNVEYRIGIYPMSLLPKDISSAKNMNKLKEVMYMMTLTICANISQKEKLRPKISFFDDKEVWDEFGANIGTYASVDGKSMFSDGYKLVNINCIYRKDRGMIVLYILVKDINEYLKNANNAEFIKSYYTIKFN